MCHRLPKNEGSSVLAPWGKNGEPVGPLKWHISLLTTEGLWEASSCYYSWMCSSAGGNSCAQWPEGTLGLFGREQKRPFLELAQIGLQPGEEEAIGTANAERIMEKPLDEYNSARLGLQGIPGACIPGLRVPSSTPKTLGWGTEPFGPLSCQAKGGVARPRALHLSHRSGLLLGRPHRK